MGRIQHYDDDYSYSEEPPARRGRRSKGKSSPCSDESRSAPPEPKKKRHQKGESSNKKAKRSGGSASPPSSRKRNVVADAENSKAEPQTDHRVTFDAGPPLASSGFGASVAGMAGMPGVPGMPGMPNIMAMSSSINTDLHRLSSYINPVEQPIATVGLEKPAKNMAHITVKVERPLVVAMTAANRKLLVDESGAKVEWDPTSARMEFSGSQEQVQRANRLLTRVRTQCAWGVSDVKVRRLLKPKEVKSVRCRLAPMDTLPGCTKMLSSQHPLIKMGKGPDNHLILPNPHKVLSRQHCIVEFDENRGAVYIHDCSANGTFLNGNRLPAQEAGKVLVSHGDELLFQDPRDPAAGKQAREYGYIVNLEELEVKAEMKLEGPRRVFSQEELSVQGRG